MDEHISVQQVHTRVQETEVLWLRGQAYHFKIWNSFNFTHLGSMVPAYVSLATIGPYANEL